MLAPIGSLWRLGGGSGLTACPVESPYHIRCTICLRASQQRRIGQKNVPVNEASGVFSANWSLPCNPVIRFASLAGRKAATYTFSQSTVMPLVRPVPILTPRGLQCDYPVHERRVIRAHAGAETNAHVGPSHLYFACHITSTGQKAAFHYGGHAHSR